MVGATNTARRDDIDVFPFPQMLTLRVRTEPNETDKKAEALVRQLISEYGRNPDEVLRVDPRADWPPSDDPPDFPFPQLIVEDVFWKGLDAIERYVGAMRQLHTR